MRNKDYLRMYRNKSLMEKITAFGESIERMDAAEFHGAEARWHQRDKADLDYYSKEYTAQLRRVNALYGMIRKDIKDMEARLNGEPGKRN